MTKRTNKKPEAISVTAALRAPHHATAEVVELAGSEVAKMLYAAFRMYNAKHFDGELAQGLVLITNTGSSRTWGDYCARDVHGIDSRIRIAPKTLTRGERFAVDVLLHEMIHAWQSEIVEDTEDGYRGHGPGFAAKCNEIGAALGLPPVGVKGRDGLPNCAHWPLCVRPDGYYGTDYTPPTRKPSKPKAPRTGGGGGDGGEGGEGGESALDALQRALVLLRRDMVSMSPSELVELSNLGATIAHIAGSVQEAAE